VLDAAGETRELIPNPEVAKEFSIPFHGIGSWMFLRPGATGSRIVETGGCAKVTRSKGRWEA
jgi:hypothetical protein